MEIPKSEKICIQCPESKADRYLYRPAERRDLDTKLNPNTLTHDIAFAAKTKEAKHLLHSTLIIQE